MLKSVTVAPYKKNSDTGQKARFLIRDLSSCSTIFNTNCEIYGQDQPYEEFEESAIDSPDFCIQYVKFENFIRTKYKDIGIFEPSFRNLNQQENYLKLLDSIIVRSHAQKKILPVSIRERATVVRPNIGKVPRQSSMKKLGGSLSFYISALEEHSNLDIVLSSYLQTFTVNDNVILNISSSAPEEMANYIETTRDRLSMYGKIPLYPAIAIYNNASIHQQSDCLIDVGMTYDISLQTMIATAHANPIICCNHDGLLQWIDEDSCYLVKSYAGCRESSLVGNIPEGISLAETMRAVYENRDGFKNKQDMMLDVGYKSFYYRPKENVGDTICSQY